jgi:CheB methylesterase
MDAVKADGRITFARDESARDNSMPRSAIAAGCVDIVLSPENIASALRRGPQARGRSEECSTSTFLDEPSHSKDARIRGASHCL